MKTTLALSNLERFDQLGKLSWLWMSSPLHRDWPLHSAARFLLPAIQLQQFHVIERDDIPVAYCSWAWLSPEAEMIYMLNPSAIETNDWCSGDRLWFIDWIAPFAKTDSWTLRRAMMQRFPDEVARAIRVKREQRKARVMEFKGPQLDSEVSQSRLNDYYGGFLQAAQQLSTPLDTATSISAMSAVVAERLSRYRSADTPQDRVTSASGE